MLTTINWKAHTHTEDDGEEEGEERKTVQHRVELSREIVRLVFELVQLHEIVLDYALVVEIG